MRRLGRLGAASLAFGAIATLTFAGSSAGHGTEAPAGPLTKKAIMFAADGMRPDLMERYADKGIMPTFKFDEAGRAERTACFRVPAEHGRGMAHPLRDVAGRARLDEQHVPPHGTNFDSTTSFSTNGVLQADTILQSAERAGEGLLDGMVAARALRPELQGPVVDFRTFIGGRGIVLNSTCPGSRRSRTASASSTSGRRWPSRPAGRTFGLVQPGEADDFHARERTDPGRRRLGRYPSTTRPTTGRSTTTTS